MAGGFDQATLAKIPETFQAIVDKGAVSGFVSLVWRKGEIVQLSTVGHRNVEAKLPMQRDTMFRIASMTKPVTSAAAMMLVEERRIALDDPISKHLPEFAGARVLRDPAGPLSETVPANREPTVDDLLTHRSGLTYSFSASGELAKAQDELLGPAFVRTIGGEDWVKALASLPLAYQPGERMHYSQSTDVLGFLVARVEGRPLGEVLKHRIFDPLNMRDTAFWVPADKMDRMAGLYTKPADGSPLRAVPLPLAEQPPVFEGGGEGLISTLDDYLAFARMLLNRGAIDGVRLLRSETVADMASNHLTSAQREMDFLGLPFWQSMGFGLGLSVIMDPVKHEAMGAGGTGSFGWPGAFGTWWQADPVNDMILMYLIQDNVELTAETVVGAEQQDVPSRTALFQFQKLAYEALK
jgi:CubicO group peptidase (beta-lactamase class C family)